MLHRADDSHIYRKAVRQSFLGCRPLQWHTKFLPPPGSRNWGNEARQQRNTLVRCNQDATRTGDCQPVGAGPGIGTASGTAGESKGVFGRVPLAATQPLARPNSPTTRRSALRVPLPVPALLSRLLRVMKGVDLQGSRTAGPPTNTLALRRTAGDTHRYSHKYISTSTGGF